MSESKSDNALEIKNSGDTRINAKIILRTELERNFDAPYKSFICCCAHCPEIGSA